LVWDVLSQEEVERGYFFKRIGLGYWSDIYPSSLTPMEEDVAERVYHVLMNTMRLDLYTFLLIQSILHALPSIRYLMGHPQVDQYAKDRTHGTRLFVSEQESVIEYLAEHHELLLACLVGDPVLRELLLLAPYTSSQELLSNINQADVWLLPFEDRKGDTSANSMIHISIHDYCSRRGLNERSSAQEADDAGDE